MNRFALNKFAITQEAEALKLSPDIILQLETYANWLSSNKYDDLFSQITEDFFTCGKWLNASEMPDFLQKLPDNGLLFLASALSVIPLVKKRFAEKNLPSDLLAEGLTDIRIWCLDHIKNHGTPGLKWGLGLHWIFMRIFTGEVLRFGRLECNKGFSYPDTVILRNRQTNMLQALHNNDNALDIYGFITDDPAKTARHGEKIKRLFSAIEAFPLRKNGSVAEKKEIFSAEDWEGFLLPGDNVLSLHIPADGKMDIESCLASLRSMQKFHNSNGYDFKAFVCGSWFLDAAMEKFAGANSNMVKFRDLGILLGPASASNDMIYRVFGTTGTTGKNELKTKLQQNLAEHLASGGIFRGGRIIIDPQSI